MKRSVSIFVCFAIVMVSVFWRENVWVAKAGPTTDIFTSSGTWTAPAGVTSVENKGTDFFVTLPLKGMEPRGGTKGLL